MTDEEEMDMRAEQLRREKLPKPPPAPSQFDQSGWPPPPVNTGPPPREQVQPRRGRRERRGLWSNEIEYCQVCPGKDAEIDRIAADLDAAKAVAAQAISDRNAAQEMARLAKVAEKEAEQRLFQFMSDNGFIGKAHMVDDG